MVQAQTLPEELDVPLRPQMQLPICGKIEPVAKITTGTAEAVKTKAPTTSVTVGAAALRPAKAQSAYSAIVTGESASSIPALSKTVNYPLEATPLTAPKSPPAAKVAKLPVGTFNQTQHVKEFSWLPEDTASQVEEPQAKKESRAKKSSAKVEASVEETDASSSRESVVNSSKESTAQTPSKPKSAQTASASKEHKIDSDAVKVAKKPHCSGVADYYADMFHGRKTASGQLHDREKFTAAHRTLPFGSKLKVVNRNTGKACIVTVNDRGPFTKNKIIDLSSAAARELGLMTAKSRLVDCYLVENE